MNKIQLVDALAERLGDRRTAVAAVDGLLETIVDTVRSGDSVALTGFGVFEARPRAARTARNPRTGAVVAVPATTVPAFRPGAGFRAAVGAGRANGAASVDVSAPSPVAAEPAVEAPATRGKNGAKAAKGSKDGKAAKARDDKGRDDKGRDDKARDDKGKGAKAKKAKAKK